MNKQYTGNEMELTRVYRYWQYFRLGFSKYLTYPVTLINFMTLTYLYVIERFPFLASLHFILFVFITFMLVMPLGTLLGWFDMRKSRIHSTEVVVATESNPMNIHIQRVTFENTLILFKALKIEPIPEWTAIYEYWKRLDKWKWQP